MKTRTPHELVKTPSNSEAEDDQEHEAQDQPGPEQADDAEAKESAPGQDRYLWLQSCAEDRLKTMNTEVKLQHDLFKAGDGGLGFRHAPKCAAESHKDRRRLRPSRMSGSRSTGVVHSAQLQHSLTHSLTLSLTHSFTHPVHSLTHSLTHSHVLTHSLVHSSLTERTHQVLWPLLEPQRPEDDQGSMAAIAMY